ncbi:MAG TPA: diguanylate cyclase [Terriglobales bacterium]|nr:diguanylate cyclase [Terriglobales bacterium]
MDSGLVSMIIVPGITALLLLLISAYLYRQSRSPFFLVWQVAWASYFVSFALLSAIYLGYQRPWVFLLANLLQIAMAIAIIVSLRPANSVALRFVWYDFVLLGAAVAIAVSDTLSHFAGGAFQTIAVHRHLGPEVFIALILAYAANRFLRLGRQRESTGYRILSAALLAWALLLLSGLLGGVWASRVLSMDRYIGPLAQMVIGMALVVILYEQERRTVQENSLFFSTLDVDNTRLAGPAEVSAGFEKILRRMMSLVGVDHAAIFVGDEWRSVLPNVVVGFTPEFAHNLHTQHLSEYLIDLAYRRGGVVTLRNLPHLSEPLPPGPPGHFERLRTILVANSIRDFSAVSLQTRDRKFGVVLLPHRPGRALGPSHVRLLLGISMQIGLTIESHVSMQETRRRTREYELLTQVGQVVSSHLNSDEVLRAIHKEIGLLVDVHNFYIAFQSGDELRFEFDVRNGETVPKHSRRIANGFSEYVIRTGQPLLIKSGLEDMRARLGITFVPEQRAQSFCAVPIFMSGRSVGIMAALHYTEEFVFSERDVELLQTAAGQVSVAVENARLFEEQQRRARYLIFLNNISKTAISSQDAEQMLGEIVYEIQKNFDLDHIGIGVLDYANKEIEIKAEAGTTNLALGKRVPLGTGILGKVARTNDMMLVQDVADGPLLGILPESRSVLCLPLTYGETLLGVLNVESRRAQAFAEQEVLTFRTLADLLATALHNAFVFQKLQQQSITDGLTGIKTRRFFIESVQAEWKRASRAGRPFSVVMVDLDKFKEVNDTMGHLEGDLVLARVGRLLEQKCRQSNVVARYGGDEFVILMPETGIEQAQILSERLRLWIATDPMLNERRITGSFGVAAFPLHGSTVEDIIRVSDAGMYVSKHAGGNRVSTAEEFKEGETSAVQRQLIASYIEGFLKRETMGPESADELVATLRKMCAGLQDDPEPMREAIIVLARAAEARELQATGHGHSVARYAEIIGQELGLSEQELADLMFAALVHDVGKLVMPERLLVKQGPLSEDEYYIIKMHAALSSEIVECVPKSGKVAEIVRHHHERYDGSGYPDGLHGEQIPLGARVLAVADAYASMIGDRPFSSGRTIEEAASEIERGSGTQFDPILARLLLNYVRGEQEAANF